MELIRILAKDSRSATEEILKKYGDDALIISNQRINGKNELIVAVDLEEANRNFNINPSENLNETAIDFADIFESKLSNARGKSIDKNLVNISLYWKIRSFTNSEINILNMIIFPKRLSIYETRLEYNNKLIPVWSKLTVIKYGDISYNFNIVFLFPYFQK